MVRLFIAFFLIFRTDVGSADTFRPPTGNHTNASPSNVKFNQTVDIQRKLILIKYKQLLAFMKNASVSSITKGDKKGISKTSGKSNLRVVPQEFDTADDGFPFIQKKVREVKMGRVVKKKKNGKNGGFSVKRM